ncbi:MAG: M81 family metallopeptidase, partial [Pseudomonadota bacterium]
MKKRVFYSCLATETNSFSNIPTNYASFAETGLRRGREVLYEVDGSLREESRWLHDLAEHHGFELLSGMYADASPSAPVQHADYLRLRDELLAELQENLPVDAVFLNLHGAMMSTECSDCEGDVLEQVRAVLGSEVPIGVVLDPHAHVTVRMVNAASVMAFMKEYPHTDGMERGAEVMSMLSAMLQGAIKPTPALLDCELVGFFPTQNEPMRSFVDGLQARESQPGVLSISFIHGFPWGDCPEAGARILVYTNSDTALAREVATNVQQELWGIKEHTGLALQDYPEAVASLEERRVLEGRPIILADVADNPGGGAPSDSTFILQALLERGIEDVALGLLYDPEAVRFCHRAGLGARLELRLGGKLNAFSGLPLDLDVTVKGLATDAQMDVLGLVKMPMGDTAWVHSRGIDIVLSSIRTQMYAPAGFSHLGLDPRDKSALVV